MLTNFGLDKRIYLVDFIVQFRFAIAVRDLGHNDKLPKSFPCCVVDHLADLFLTFRHAMSLNVIGACCNYCDVSGGNVFNSGVYLSCCTTGVNETISITISPIVDQGSHATHNWASHHAHCRPSVCRWRWRRGWGWYRREGGGGNLRCGLLLCWGELPRGWLQCCDMLLRCGERPTVVLPTSSETDASRSASKRLLVGISGQTPGAGVSSLISFEKLIVSISLVRSLFCFSALANFDLRVRFSDLNCWIS